MNILPATFKLVDPTDGVRLDGDRHAKWDRVMAVDRPTLSDFALTSAADDAVVRSLALIQHARHDLAATRHLVEEGLRSIKRSRRRLNQLSRTQRRQ